MADELTTKRIINLPAESAPAAGDVLVVDNETTGTKKLPVANLIDAAAESAISQTAGEIDKKLLPITGENAEWSTPENGKLNVRGIWESDSAWISTHTNKLYCEEGWVFESCGGTLNGSIAPSALFFSGDTLVSHNSHAIGTTQMITIPNGVDGVVFQVANTASGGLPDNYYVIQKSPITFDAVCGEGGKKGQFWTLQEEGAEWSDIGPYIEDKVNYKNLPLAVSDDTVGYLNNNGSKNGNTAWHCIYTDRIKCNAGDKYRYVGGTQNGIVNSILYFYDGIAASQIRYPAGSDVEIEIPDGVNEVIFQSAAGTSYSVVLEVKRTYPYALEDVINDIDSIDQEIETIKTNPFYNKVENISIFDNEALYTKTAELTNARMSPRKFPEYTYIDRVRFKAGASGDGYIVIADASIYDTHRYMHVVKLYPVSVEEGWNEVAINFNTGGNAGYIIGFYNIGVLYDDYRTLPQSTPNEYRFGDGSLSYQDLTVKPPVEDGWTSASSTAAGYFICYAFTTIAYGGIIPTDDEKTKEAYEYMAVNTQLQDGTLLPKYEVINGQSYGFVGRWYDWTYNNNAVKVASAAGAEVCFKVSGTTSITVNWTGDNINEHTYFCYYIDGAQKVRRDITDNIITLPDTNEHVIRIVCESIPHTASVNCWTVGYGWVFGGVDAGNGTLKGIVPTNPTIMYFGDSLTEGVRAYGAETGEQVEADVDSATESYGWYASKYLGCTSIITGYGSTGIFANGYFKKCIDALNYLANGIETPDISPNLIVINHGHNDTGSEDWIAGFNAVLDRIMVKYPGVKVVGLSPFNGRHADDMKTCCDARSWCYYINTDNWRLLRYYADGPGHLTAEGAEVCGRELAKEIIKQALV